MSKAELKRKLETILSQCRTEEGVVISDLNHVSTWNFEESNRGDKGELALYGLSRFGYNNRQKFRRAEPISAEQFMSIISVKNEYNKACSEGNIFESDFNPMQDLLCGDCGLTDDECYCGEDEE